MKSDYKKAKSILTLGIISLLLEILTIILLVIFIIDTTNNVVFNYYGQQVSLEISSLLFILIPFLLIGVILSFTGSILILTSRFSNKSIKEMQTTWGLLSLLLLGAIGCIIFGSKAKGQSKKILADETIEAELL